MRGISSFDTEEMKLLREIHQRGDGFRVEVEDPRYPDALARLVKADAWGQLKRELKRAWWGEHGDAWRKARKASAKRSQRKRGK